MYLLGHFRIAMKYSLSALFLLLFSFTIAVAQTEEQWLAFKIIKVDQKGNTYTLTIGHGSELNIKQNQNGELWTTVNSQRQGPGNYVTSFKIQEVKPGYAKTTVESETKILPGDMLFLQIQVKQQFHSSYFYLAAYGIDLLDESGKPHYTLSEILESDGYRLRTEKFIRMQMDINEAGRKLKESGNTDKVKEGENKGEFVHTMLTTADTIAVWTYLYHLTQSFEQTMGQAMPLVKSYTEYITEGDLITPVELKQKFVGVNQELWEKRYNAYKKRINKELLDTWVNEAKKFREDSDYKKSEELLLPSIFLSSKLGNPFDEGVYIYELALVYDGQKDDKNSIVYFLDASKKFKEADNPYAQSFGLHYAAKAYSTLLNDEEAKKYFAQALALREGLYKKEPANESYQNELYTTLDAMAIFYRDQEDFELTMKYYNQALELTRAIKNETKEADTYWNIGYAETEIFDKDAEGILSYEKAYKLYEIVRDSGSMIDLRRNQAINYSSLKNFEKAKQSIAAGIALARQWGKPNKLAYVLDYQGLLHYESKLYPQSIASYTESEKIYKALGNNEKLLQVKKNLANGYRDSKNYTQALAKLQERPGLVKEENISAKADAWWELALLHGKDHLNNPKKAIEFYALCEKNYITLKDTASWITILNNVGYEYRDLKDSVNSYKTHEKALKLASSKALRYNKADTYERYAFSAGSFKNITKKLNLFKESKRIYSEINEFKKAGYVAEKMAGVYQDNANYEMAGILFKESIDLYNKSGNKADEAETYWDYGYNQGQHLRQFDVAIASYHTAYDLYMQEKDSVNASVMLSNIGQNYWSKRNFDKAIESHKAAIQLASKCKNYEQEASSWSKLASLYSETNNPIAGTEALRKSLDAAKHLNDSTLLSTAYHDLAASYLSAKEYQQSIDYFANAIAIRKAKKDSISWAASLYSLAGVYQGKTEYKKSEQVYQETLKIQRRIKDQSGVVYTLANLGSLAQSADNNYSQADVYFREAVKLSIQLKDENILAYCYLRIKSLYRSQGKSALADEYSQKALDLYKKNKQWKDVATTLVDIGYDASYIYGDNQKAVKLFDEAQVMADTLNDAYTKAVLTGARGTVMREIGEFNKALVLVNQSKNFYEELKNTWGMAGVHIDLGNIYKQMSEYTLALRHQQMADSLYTSVRSDYSRLAPLANIGEIYLSQGDYAKSLTYYEQSLAIMKKANDLNENLGIIQACIGEAYFYLANYAESDKWLKESLKTCDLVGAMRAKADALGVMARLKIEENKYDEASKYLKEGLTLAKSKSLKISYVSMLSLSGQLDVKRKNYAAAKPALEECIKLSRDMGKSGTLWEGLYWLGVLYKENKQLPQSKQYLTEAVEVIEKIRNKVSGGEEARKMFSSDKNILKVYEALVSVLLDLNETDLAMSYIQKNNEDNLKAKFKGIDVKFENKDKNTILEKERDMKAKLDGIEQQIANEKALPTEKQNLEKLKNLQGTKTVAEGDYLKFVNQQVNVRPELSKFFNNSVQPAQLKGKKKQIPKDMALLSYLPGENQLYIFIATSDTVLAKVVDISRSDLTKNINAVLNIVRTHQGTFGKIDLKTEEAERREIVSTVTQTDPMLKPFEELYHYMIAPVSAEIANKKRLCVIPNGALSYIPFQLLGKTLKNGKFSLLMNQYAIFYANSTDMLLRSIEEGDRKFNILAFGNPDKSLPSTEKEVIELKKLFPNAAIFLREEATEDKAKFASEEYNVMHFATHGNLDYEDFGKSFLTMAENPSKDEDGLLTLEELWGMDVMSHLNIVVLSACQTAVSKGSDESSPVSPASGFLQNGVKSVVATLWKVDDEATSLLIMDFYKNIKTMDALDALRLAQVNLANHPKYGHPYYWAAAVLLGDWR